ncbi:mitochondrial fission regulator 2-like [Athalia rosae]|uniref:mitochondrial fission regulator 2-like n=1 Tax=Athalia rosae TaxID=37344 RepID=UPI002033F45D|nr:mitochondrial fission regulator 2-like [Athalia rosae]
MAEAPKYYGKNRSIIRRIGSFLPLKPLPKIYVSVTALHSMTSSMIDDDPNCNTNDTDGLGLGSGRLSGSKPDLLETISFGSEVRLLALEQELQEMREKIATIVQHIKHTDAPNGISNSQNTHTTDPPRPPPPPPPLPPPSTPHIARRASLQDHTSSDWQKPPLQQQKSMGDILKEMDKVKLKPVARSPGGRPLRSKRESTPNNDLQEILRKRYSVVQVDSPNSKNTSLSTHDDSFTN